MSEYQEHNPGDHEDPQASSTWLIGIMGIIVLVVSVLGLTALYFNRLGVEVHDKVVTVDPQELQNLLAGQQARLDTHHLDQYDEEIALVIPIDKAMELVAQQYGGRR